jgi:hypothetical protein
MSKNAFFNCLNQDFQDFKINRIEEKNPANPLILKILIQTIFTIAPCLLRDLPATSL